MLKKKSSISRLGSALKSLVVQVAIDAGRAGLAYESVAFTDSQWSDTKGWQVHKAEMYSSSSGSSDLEEPQEIVRGRDYSLELPVEILQHILLLCAEPSMADLTNCQDRGPGWIGITRVCRRWRTAALAHHRLWARITPNLTKKWAHVLLKRSDPAPISVHLNLGQVGDSEDGQWTCRDALGILKDSARLRELSLTGSRYYLQYIIDALLYPTKLDTLALSAKDGSLRFPPLVFGGAAPLLRRLTYASGSHFRTPTWMLGNITDFATPGSFPLPELLDALRHMPLLQTLRITRSHQTWSAPDTPAAAPAPVPLDHLSLLSVTDHALPRFFALRAALVLPPSTRTHLRVVTSGIPSWEPWADKLVRIQPLLAAAGGLRRLSVSGTPHTGAFRARSAADGADAPGSVRFELRWARCAALDAGSRTLHATDSPFYYLAGLCVRLAAAPHATHLTVAAGDGEPVGRWVSVLRQLPALETLAVRGGGSTGTLRSMAGGCPDSAPTCPLLRELRLVGARVADAAALCAFLRGRTSGAGEGPQPQRLVVIFEGCVVEAATLAELRAKCGGAAEFVVL